MPTTPTFGIHYPCLTPTVDPADFRIHAFTMESALASVNALVSPLVNRDIVIAQAVNPSIAVNTTTTVSWNTPLANPSGMWTPGSPTVFTLQSSGTFLVSLGCQTNNSPTTFTSLRGVVLLNGTEQVWGKEPGSGSSSPEFTVAGLLVSASFGDQVSCTMLWGGTGGPISPLFDIQICKISDV